MSREFDPAQRSEDAEALAHAWPRPLIASGRGDALARAWCRSRATALDKGDPGCPRHPLTPALRHALFESRRARWVVRGLEESAKALAGQQAGLRQAPATQVEAGKRRVSRLLVLSRDGSTRFYREVEKLCRLHGARVEALILECDEGDLGEAVFGDGQVARAVLLDHKDAVVLFLSALDFDSDPAPSGHSV